MAQQIVMPKLGLTMSEGLLAAWLVEEGETVSKGQLLADIETEKIVMQVESPADGILAKYLAEPGDTVPVGEPIAWITQLGEDIPVYTATSTTAPTAIIDEQPPVQATSSSKPMAKGQISPNAKRLARELGVDLSTLTGSGPGGAISGEDVKAAAAASKPSGALTPLTGMRKTIAERMATSNTTAPRVTLFSTVDLTDLVATREARKAEATACGATPTSYTDIIVKAVAMVLRELPYMNASFTDAGIVQNTQVNVGVAVEVENGLMVPVVKDADTKDITAITTELRQLLESTRNNALTPDELSGGTFTVTNLGGFGIDAFTPIINLPECAILGVGRIAPTAAVLDGQLAIRQCTVLSLVFDHRVVDGAPAARFLQRLSEVLCGANFF